VQEGSSSGADDVSKDLQEKGIVRQVASSFEGLQRQVSSTSEDADTEGLPVRRRSQSDLSHAKAKAKISSPSLSAKTVQLPLSPDNAALNSVSKKAAFPVPPVMDCQSLHREVR
jgi:hypothetical protein